MTEPRYNLLRHGYERCAQFVLGRLRDHRRMVYVYIAPNGDVHCRTNRILSGASRYPLIGCYTFRVQPNVVEDDMLAWLRERTQEIAA